MNKNEILKPHSSLLGTGNINNNSGFGQMANIPQSSNLFGGEKKDSSNLNLGLFGNKSNTEDNKGNKENKQFGTSNTGLFGENNLPKPEGSIFGGISTQAKKEESLSFGGNSQPKSDGSFFGGYSLPKNDGSLFGGNTQSKNDGSLFGGNIQSKSYGLFGENSIPKNEVPLLIENSQSKNDGSLFGGNSQPKNDGSLFGGNKDQSKKDLPVQNFTNSIIEEKKEAPLQVSLFGTSNNQPKINTNANASGALFGSNINQQKFDQSSSLFGDNKNQDKKESTTNLFGNKSNNDKNEESNTFSNLLNQPKKEGENFFNIKSDKENKGDSPILGISNERKINSSIFGANVNSNVNSNQNAKQILESQAFCSNLLNLDKKEATNSNNLFIGANLNHPKKEINSSLFGGNPKSPVSLSDSAISGLGLGTNNINKTEKPEENKNNNNPLFGEKSTILTNNNLFASDVNKNSQNLFLNNPNNNNLNANSINQKNENEEKSKSNLFGANKTINESNQNQNMPQANFIDKSKQIQNNNLFGKSDNTLNNLKPSETDKSILFASQGINGKY
jgi:hypothetical protein